MSPFLVDEPGALAVATPRLLNRPPVPLVFTARGTRAPLLDGAALAVACHLVPAMAQGLPLRLAEAPDATLAASLPGLVELLARFDPRLRPIRVEHPEPATDATPPAAGVGLFFTGGVDSFHHLLAHGDGIDALVHVLGFDQPDEPGPLRDATLAMLEAVAAETGRRLIVVSTTLRTYLDAHVPWGTSHGAALAAVAHALRGELGTLHIPSSLAGDEQVAWGSHPDLDARWSSATTRIVHGTVELDRREKTRAIAASPLALRHLRVCWENRDGAYTCGRCAKCLRTMLDLELAGALREAATFPDAIDPAALRALPPLGRIEQILLDGTGRALRAAGRADEPLAEAIDEVLARPLAAGAAPPPEPLVVGPARVVHAGGRVELTAPVRHGDVASELRIGYPASEPPERPGDALALLLVHHAMRLGTTLRVEDAVSADVLAHLAEAQRRWATIRVWQATRTVPIEAAVVAPPRVPKPGRGWACAFTGGVDSWQTALAHRDRVRYLVYLHGIDEEEPAPARRARDGERLAADAAALGMEPVEVDLNVRKVVVRDLGGVWDETYAIAPTAIAHLLADRAERFLVPGEVSYAELQAARETAKYHPYLDRPTGGSAVAITTAGMELRRHEKVALLARDHAWVLPRLRVCFAELTDGHVGGPNCGRCEKCLRTLAALRACGALALGAEAFDAPFDLERLAATTVPVSSVGEIRTGFHLALLERLRERDADVPLQEALRALLVRSRAALPRGPEATIGDRVLAWRSSPAWAEYLASDAETWLHALLAHTAEAELRDALLADPAVPALLARTRLRRAAR